MHILIKSSYIVFLKVFLFIVFFLILTPLSLIFLIIKKISYKKNEQSYLINRTKQPNSMNNQF